MNKYFFKEVKRQVKHFFQRQFRGYDDSFTWAFSANAAIELGKRLERMMKIATIIDWESEHLNTTIGGETKNGKQWIDEMIEIANKIDNEQYSDGFDEPMLHELEERFWLIMSKCHNFLWW